MCSRLKSISYLSLFRNITRCFHLNPTADYPIIHQICANHGITINTLQVPTGSFGKEIFMINDMFLLRTSTKSMAREQENFRRIATLPQVPQLEQVGQIEHADAPLYYTLLTLLPGHDFVDAYANITIKEQETLGQDVAHFLDLLHAHNGPAYDIGLYIPAIPAFGGSWRAGHEAYWQQVHGQCTVQPWRPEHKKLIDRAFDYLAANAHALDFQTGPTLLHNDFHPKNILLDQGRFSGVIDWECAQYGEPDFELCHLIHWTRYPPRPEIDFRPFLQALMVAAPRCTQVPALSTRLTIYQIEHEIQQMLWQGETAKTLRIPRLEQWLNDGITHVAQGWGIGA